MLPPSLKSEITASKIYPISLLHFVIVIFLLRSAGYFVVINPYASSAIKSLLSSILFAAS